MISISLHIPISPNISFYSKIKWIRKSLDFLGEPYSSAKIHLTVSNEDGITINTLINSYPEFKENISRYRFYITNKISFDQYSYGETAGLRFKNIDNSDITIFCDADIFFIKRIDDILNNIIAEGGIYGVLAHTTPFQPLEKTNEEWWNYLSLKYTNQLIPLNFKHTLNSKVNCPLYYNNGFIIGKTIDWKKIKDFSYSNFKDIFNILPLKYLNNDATPRLYCMQISFALALHKFKIKTAPLSDIYNCANDQGIANILQNEINDIRIVHYLRKTAFDRDVIFVNKDSVDRFLSIENLDVISKIFQISVQNIIEFQGYN